MEQILAILGFTSLAGILWNLFAYAGMIAIIVAVLSKKWRNKLFFWGPLALFLYAQLYLHNPILAGLQYVVTASGLMNLRNVKETAPLMVGILTLAVLFTLAVTGQLWGLWPLIGASGLLGIAFGLTQLPHKKGYVLMAVGGVLIVIYALAFQIWVFFILNIIFFIANIVELFRKKR